MPVAAVGRFSSTVVLPSEFGEPLLLALPVVCLSQ